MSAVKSYFRSLVDHQIKAYDELDHVYGFLKWCGADPHSALYDLKSENDLRDSELVEDITSHIREFSDKSVYNNDVVDYLMRYRGLLIKKLTEQADLIDLTEAVIKGDV